MGLSGYGTVKKHRQRYWHLIVRREIKARDDIKYSLSNAPAHTSLQRLATMQGQRYWSTAHHQYCCLSPDL